MVLRSPYSELSDGASFPRDVVASREKIGNNHRQTFNFGLRLQKKTNLVLRIDKSVAENRIDLLIYMQRWPRRLSIDGHQ